MILKLLISIHLFYKPHDYSQQTTNQTSMTVWNLVHGNLNLDRRVDLDGGDALDDLNRARDKTLANTSSYVTRSITRLWILISRCSQELVPSPQGDLRVVMRRTLVGMRTGPETFTFLLRAMRLISEHTTELLPLIHKNTLLHSLDVGRGESDTDAVHLLIDNFILLHWCFYLWEMVAGEFRVGYELYAEIKYWPNRHPSLVLSPRILALCIQFPVSM